MVDGDEALKAELLHGEDPGTHDPEDIRHWVAVYREMLAMAHGLGNPVAARFETRLRFWRLKQAQADAPAD